MSLTVYRRGPIYWIRGSVRGRPIRRSLSTRNKEVAHHRAAELELGVDQGLEPLRWPELRERFIARYSGTTAARWRQLFKHLESHFQNTPPQAVTALELDAFLHRKERTPNTQRHEISNLRALWRWAIDHQVVGRNVAAQLRMPTETPAETQPFSREELAALEAAIDELAAGRGLSPEIRDRTWAMYQILRTTGIRVSDLVKLRPEHIVGNHLILRTQKTKGAVRIPLLDAARAALVKLKPLPSGYYFWTGNSYKGACDSVWKTFSRLGKRAGLASVHPHRLRDTFAVNLLVGGADIRLVSRLLGHSSIRTTEKHYAPWVQAFQDQADAAIRAAERAHQAALKPNKKAAR